MDADIATHKSGETTPLATQTSAFGSEPSAQCKPVPEFTMGEAIEHFGIGPFQFVLCMLCGLCWMGEAMESM